LIIRRAAKIVARGKRVAGIQANSHSFGFSRLFDDTPKMIEGMAQRSPLTCCVLHENFDSETGRFAEYDVERSRHRFDARIFPGSCVSAGMHDEVRYFQLFRPFHLIQKGCPRLL
jgi:hypothetical protein